MKIKHFFPLLLLSVFCFSLNAQVKDTVETKNAGSGWYVGLSGIAAFGKCTFNSFGTNKTNVGQMAGVFGGYRFNEIFSVGGLVKTGIVKLSVADNDFNADYWLGNDMVRYYAPVVDMEGWDYSNLTSRVSTLSFGLQGNVNIAGWFTANRRFRLEVSPVVSAVLTKARFVTIDKKETVMRHDAQWHFGPGGELMLGYRVSDNIELDVYGTFTHLIGGRYDRIPVHYSNSNFIYESGLKITRNF